MASTRRFGYARRAILLLFCAGSEAYVPTFFNLARPSSVVSLWHTVRKPLSARGAHLGGLARGRGLVARREGRAAGCSGLRCGDYLGDLGHNGVDADSTFSDAAMGVSSSETTQSEEASGLASLLPKPELKKWPKHKDKHRTLFSAPALKVDYSNMLGDGTYGEVFMGDLVGAPSCPKLQPNAPLEPARP